MMNSIASASAVAAALMLALQALISFPQCFNLIAPPLFTRRVIGAFAC
jgi:hypothetical protein